MSAFQRGLWSVTGLAAFGAGMAAGFTRPGGHTAAGWWMLVAAVFIGLAGMLVEQRGRIGYRSPGMLLFWASLAVAVVGFNLRP